VALADPLWRRAQLERRRGYLRASEGRVRARRVLGDLLSRAGFGCSRVSIHGWTRGEQGLAYLWALAFLAGREELPPPEHVRAASRWR
jgi:hypothetical protein